MNYKEQREKRIKEIKEKNPLRNIGYAEAGQYTLLIRYTKYEDHGAEVIAKVIDKTTTGIYIECEDYWRLQYTAQEVITLCIYEWVNSYKSNYNKEVFITYKI